ncbi:MAG: sensor histidine kinase [Caulobacterales bacterium]
MSAPEPASTIALPGGRSLAARLVLTAAAWSLLILALGGWGLSSLYRQSTLRQLDAQISVAIDGLLAAVEPIDGELKLPEQPNDPRYKQTFSGRYWQIDAIVDGAAKPLMRSPSLWDSELGWPASAPFSPANGVRFSDAPGPDGQRLRVGVQVIRVQGIDAPIAFLAAADRAEALRDVDRFTLTLAAALAALAAGLIAAVVLQVRVALAPLAEMQGELAAVRRGKAARLEGAYPNEVAPLTDELNKLLDHNRDVVDRARMLVGNLAHALKTPISVLRNEAHANPGAFGDLVERQAEAMARNVDHYLTRAQAAARAETLGARTPVAPVVEDIARTLERLYGRRKDIGIEVEAAAAVFRGERQDLEEMVGNLMENACKYGAGGVWVNVAAPLASGALTILVEDDGPGLAEADRAHVLIRGARLDETEAGQGFGLSIVADLARAYGGELDLEPSVHGGLRARLTLPATD